MTNPGRFAWILALVALAMLPLWSSCPENPKIELPCGNQYKCTTRDDCNPGQVCHQGCCYCSVEEGAQCEDDGACAGTCNTNTCLCNCSEESECNLPSDCPSGICDFETCTCVLPICTGLDECDVTRACPAEDQGCNLETCECECVEGLAECVLDADCFAGQLCNTSSCMCRCDTAAGADCGADSDCFDGASCDLVTCACDAAVDAPPRVATWIPDGTGDWIDSISSVEAAYRDGKIDMLTYGILTAALLAGQAAAWFNQSLFECGADGARGIVVCPQGVTDFPEGDIVTVSMRLAAYVPASQLDRSYIYSAVFDSDGVPDNDWVFQAPYDWDYFRGTDRWYQLIWSHQTEAWSLTVSQVDSSQSVDAVSSAARAVIFEDTITFYIPRSELAGGPAGYRMSAFGHDGAFTQSSRGGDVSGANPTESLQVIP